jgi:hypothetical protein
VMTPELCPAGAGGAAARRRQAFTKAGPLRARNSGSSRNAFRALRLARRGGRGVHFICRPPLGGRRRRAGGSPACGGADLRARNAARAADTTETVSSPSARGWRLRRQEERCHGRGNELTRLSRQPRHRL